jgi:molybdate transport system substrate-binding protein
MRTTTGYFSLLLLAGCITPAMADTSLIGFVPSNVATAFTELATAYGKSHPGISIRILVAGTKTINDNLDRGLADDFVVLGDRFARTNHNLIAPLPIVSSHTVIVIGPAGKTKIRTPADLAADGVRLGGGIAGSGTAYLAEQTLARLTEEYGADFASKARANVVLLRPQNTQLIEALKAGTIDAAIMFPEDAAGGGFDTVDLGERSVTITEEIAIVKGSANAAGVRAFIAFIRSPAGAAILRSNKLIP